MLAEQLGSSNSMSYRSSRDTLCRSSLPSSLLSRPSSPKSDSLSGVEGTSSTALFLSPHSDSVSGVEGSVLKSLLLASVTRASLLLLDPMLSVRARAACEDNTTA